MTRQLILVHGRSQQNRTAEDVKSEWVNSWQKGLAKTGLKLPLADADIHLPYYGQTLDDLVRGKDGDDVAKVIVRGDVADDNEREFYRSIFKEIQEKSGITDEQVRQMGGEKVIEKGVLNWKWVRAVLKSLDTYVPGASSTSVAWATRDVYLYLTTPGLRDEIETGVRAAFQPDRETVVVAHSLGTVVAYNLMKREGVNLKWKIPTFVTVGSPLAVTTIKRGLKPIGFPRCVSQWYNAMDNRDVVALYPLDKAHFDVDPPIVNKTDVDNPTPNRHGITGYMEDPIVAKRIHDALVK